MNESFGDFPRQRGAPFRREEKRRPLRQVVAEIDQEILKLLARRYNLLEKMRRRGRLDPGEEKFLRESWQAAVSKISRDGDLSGRFFSLLQNMTFLPKPGLSDEGEGEGERRRQIYNLAPSRQPLKLNIAVPAESRLTRSWLYLAAASGSPCLISPALLNGPEMDLIRALEHLGANAAAEKNTASIQSGPPLGRQDKVIYAGNEEFNFYLLLAHYLGQPSRCRLEGDIALKLADFAWLRQILPQLGCRLTHVIPKSSGLPCRLECSGILPPSFKMEAPWPASFGMALVLGASFYESPFAVDFSEHPEKENVFAMLLPVLEDCGASFRLDGSALNLEPAFLKIPEAPKPPMQPDLALFLMALALPLGGESLAEGAWPDWPRERSALDMLAARGIAFERRDNSMRLLKGNKPPEFVFEEDDSNIPLYQYPIICGIAACLALGEGRAMLPAAFWESGLVRDFFRACGLRKDREGALAPIPEKENAPIFNAPSADWALALALAACARHGYRGFQLVNPGIMNDLWPGFWPMYNSLPDPFSKQEKKPENAGEKHRRRIMTSALAVPQKKITEEDWEL